MVENNDGGPAFPLQRENYRPGDDGMSLRDYFAARAGWAPDWFEPLDHGDGIHLTPPPTLEMQLLRQARWGYAYGRAMVAERAKHIPPKEP